MVRLVDGNADPADPICFIPGVDVPFPDGSGVYVCPTIQIMTSPGTIMYYYFDGFDSVSLLELPANPALYMPAQSAGPFYQNVGLLLLGNLPM